MLFAVITFFLICTSSLAKFPLERSTIATKSDSTIDYRLPSNLEPVHYDVTIQPFFDPTFTFTGQVKIEVNVLQSTSTITLHCNELTINQNDVKVSYANEAGTSSIAVANFNIDTLKQFCIIELGEEISIGSVVDVEINYEGILNEDNKGFYRASYEDEEGNTRWLGTTQFESTSARQAFPCFDEPALKATFTINLIRTQAYMSISNMDLFETQPLTDGLFKDVFEKTVKMSTYLVAFVVSDFDNVKRENQAVFAKKQAIEDGRGVYGLDVGIQTLKAMEDFTNVPYSLSKIFQIAIPDGWFAAGAMENWGLVTYKERYLLYKDGITTSGEKQTIASIIAHEYAHQWFGNLVSPLWWKYIWLNEGFATYFEYFATSVVEPEMRMMEQFVVKTNQYAFESDSLETTRPMSFDAGSPREISLLFDRIAYDKSGAVIRMMEHFLTSSIFAKGLTIYLNNKQYDSAAPNDLWSALQTAIDLEGVNVLSGMTVSDIMETWNSQAGYPVVFVERDTRGIVKYSQSRFLLNKATHDLDQIWTIPINYATSDAPNFDDTTSNYWLKAAEESTGITVPLNQWIIVNKKETGYYRVNYDKRNWNLLIDYLNSDEFEVIDVLNRAQLVDDSLNLARSGRIEYSIPLRLIEYISRETDYIPIYSFVTGISYLNKMMASSRNYELFKLYVRTLLQKAYETLGTENTGTHTDKLNRINVINWLCRFGDERSQTAMHTKLTMMMQTPPDLQSPVYCGGMQLDSNTEMKWTYLYTRYAHTISEDLEKSRLITGLGCTKNTGLLNRLLRMCIDSADGYTLRNSDIPSAFSSVYGSSEVGLDMAFNFFIDNFTKVRAILSVNQISSIMSGMSGRLTTTNQKNKFVNFVSSQSSELTDIYGNIFSNALKNIESNIEWNDRYLGGINDWLDIYYDVTTTPPSTTTPEPSTTPSYTESVTEALTDEPTTPDGANIYKYSMFVLLSSLLTTIIFK